MIRHPEYVENIEDWIRWGDAYQSGRDFITNYTQTYSKRETDEDFVNRKKYSYVPAFAKAAIDEVKNSIFQRISDVTRKNGSSSYMECIVGRLGGVDLEGATMNSFIGRTVLPELLVKGKVGVFVDMPMSIGFTKATKPHPYLYIYRAEDILSWETTYEDNHCCFTKLLLAETKYTYDTNLRLPSGTQVQYKYFELIPEGVKVTIYDDSPEKNSDLPGKVIMEIILDIEKIPFIIAELNTSLMKDIADYQVAALNLASSDMSYSIRSNFPFYVEQIDPRYNSQYLRNSSDGTENTANTAEKREINVGASDGRTYPIGADQPAFIHPSSEPLEASMKKQQQLKEEIKQLVQLALTNVDPKMASAESKEQDQQGLEAGLSYIGLELETLERNIAYIWGLYESYNKEVTITYPKRYSIKSDNERIEEAKNLKDILHSVPSDTFRRLIVKQIATIVLGTKVSSEELKKIHNEIMEAKVIDVDPEILSKLNELGAIDLVNLAKSYGIPSEWVELAKIEHAERLARINEAQSSVDNRGVPEGQMPGDNKLDKQKGAENITKDKPTDPGRGKEKEYG